MRQVFIEVKESLANKKLFAGLILLQVFLFFLLVSVVFLSLGNVDTKTKSFYAQYKGKNVYQLSDNLLENKEIEFFMKKDSLEILKRFNKLLQDSSEFTYLNTNLQPIGVLNFKGDQKFLEGYEDGQTLKGEKTLKGEYKIIKSMQVNENVIKTFKPNMEYGKTFNHKDFTYNNGTIPVILGSEYKSLYKVGDQLNIEYLHKNVPAKVIGILEPNTIIPARENIEFYADKYIVFPEFLMESDPTTEEEYSFQKMQYLGLINGQILTEKDNLQIRKSLNEISNLSNFDEFTIIGANDLGINIMFSMMKQNKILLLTLVIALFIFSIFSISLSLVMKWDINIKKYSTHLVFGATVKHILFYIFVEIFSLVLLPLLLIFYCTKFIGSMPNYYYFSIIILGIIVTLLGILPFYIKLRNLKLSEILKREV